eukprot:12436673-Alexandrium_andersonii.AAC.1
MSASLVGSEMCIRDSFVRGLSKLMFKESVHREESLVLKSARSRTRRRWACLLYTSDAADDM